MSYIRQQAGGYNSTAWLTLTIEWWETLECTEMSEGTHGGKTQPPWPPRTHACDGDPGGNPFLDGDPSGKPSATPTAATRCMSDGDPGGKQFLDWEP